MLNKCNSDWLLLGRSWLGEYQSHDTGYCHKPYQPFTLVVRRRLLASISHDYLPLLYFLRRALLARW